MISWPIGWHPAMLSDVAAINMGQSPDGSGTNAIGEGLPLIGGASDLGKNTPVVSRFTSAPTKMCEAGDIIYCIRATIGKLNIADKRYCLGRGVAGFRSIGIDDSFLRWLMVSKRIDIAALGTGTTFVQVSKDDLATLDVAIPPFNEQRRIVAKLDGLFEKSRAIRDKLDRVPRLLAKLHKSILNAAFRGDLTREWRAKNPDVEPASTLLEQICTKRRAKWEADLLAKGKDPKKAKYVEPAAVDRSRHPDLPAGWCWASVSSLSSKVVDGVHKKPNYVHSGIPFLTVKNLTGGRELSFDDCRYVTPEDHEQFCQRTKPEPGDILITKDGTLGVARAIRSEVEFSIFVSLALVKPVLFEMSDYLELAFMSPQVQKQMTGTGSGLQHIHLVDLRADMIPLAPLREQIEIVRRLSAALHLAAQIGEGGAAAAIRSAALDSQLLNKAFRGELVSQDPTDEPASVLLERIRAERAAAGPSRRTRTKKLTSST
jgi:type I restriction enzyme S subunit